MVRVFVLSLISTVVTLVLATGDLLLIQAQVMQSTSYAIQSDSINVGGIENGSSTNYNLRTTVGEVGTGESNSASYAIGAGYRQMQEVFISLTGAANVVMSPTLSGVTGGEANGSTTVTVVTDSPSGYVLTLVTENAPAMRTAGADTLADYDPTGLVPDFSFSTAGTEAHFGFSPEGVDIVQRYQDDGGSCGTGSFDAALSCWDGPSTTALTIAQATSANQPSGATTTIHFRVGVGDSVAQTPGIYIATTTVTALPL